LLTIAGAFCEHQVHLENQYMPFYVPHMITFDHQYWKKILSPYLIIKAAMSYLT